MQKAFCYYVTATVLLNVLFDVFPLLKDTYLFSESSLGMWQLEEFIFLPLSNIKWGFLASFKL